MRDNCKVLKGLRETDLSFCNEAASFLQSGFWGSFKARFGWEARAYRVEWETPASPQSDKCPCEVSGADSAKPLLVLSRPLSAGFSFAYIPWGPELPEEFLVDSSAGAGLRRAALKELSEMLKEKLPRDTAFIRFDPPWFVKQTGYAEGLTVSTPSVPLPFIHAGADIQPPDTVLVDLRPSMESVLQQMKPKWRYNARLALKKGVTVRRAGPEAINVFYDLLKETARRDGIATHGIEYYRTLLEEGQGSVLTISLYLAEHEGDLLAAIVTLFRGKDAIYLYGASSDKKRSLMAPYALQVKAMEDAQAAGCSTYDLFGIPPDEDPSHPMAGLYRFKTGFGGRIIHRPGSWDYPCRPVFYRLFRCAETLRKNVRTLKKKFRRGMRNANI